LIIAKQIRGNGVGNTLLSEAEKISQKNNSHKIYLHTGKAWRAASFYKKMGYKLTHELPNHYFHQDFVEFTKFFNSDLGNIKK